MRHALKEHIWVRHAESEAKSRFNRSGFFGVVLNLEAMRRRLSRLEIALFVVPLALVPAAIYGQRLKLAFAPRPVPLLRPASAPIPNLYSNFWPDTLALLPSPDGKWVTTGVQGAASQTKFAKWNARDGQLMRRFGRYRFGDADALLSPDGQILGFGSGGSNGDRVVLLDAAGGKERRRIVKPKSVAGGYSDFDLSNRAVAVTTDDDVLIFRSDNGRPMGKLRHRVFDYFPKKPRFSPDGRQLAWIGFSNRDFNSYANGSSNDEVVWFDLNLKKRVGAVEFSHCDLFNVRFSGDGRTLLVCGFRRYWVKSSTGHNDVSAQATMWAVDARSGHKKWDWNMSGWVKDTSASPDGRFFATEQNFGAKSDHVTVREVSGNREVCRVPGNFYGQPAWSADSRTLYLPSWPIKRLELRSNGRWKLHNTLNAR